MANGLAGPQTRGRALVGSDVRIGVGTGAPGEVGA
jgi:hypothetical protein